MIIDPSLLFGGASVQVAPRSKEDNSCAANASLWAGVVLSSRAFDGLEIPMFTGSVRTTRTSYDPKYGITTMYFTGKYRSWTNLSQKVQATVGLENGESEARASNLEFPRFKTAAIMWKIWRVESYRNAVQLQRRNDACTRPLPCGTSERSSFLMPIVCMAWMRRSNISTSSTSSTRLPKQALAPAGCASGILQCFAARSCQKREVRELLKTSARVIASVRTKIKFPSLPIEVHLFYHLTVCGGFEAPHALCRNVACQHTTTTTPNALSGLLFRQELWVSVGLTTGAKSSVSLLHHPLRTSPCYCRALQRLHLVRHASRRGQ